MSKNMKKVWMLRVKYALDHHALVLKPLAESILYALAGSGHPCKYGSRRGGANSNYVDISGKRFFLYGVIKRDPGIEVRKRVRGPVLVKLQNERDVLRWVASL